MSDSKFYACWKPSGDCFKCSKVCMPFNEAEKFLEEKRMSVGTLTTLEECRLRPQIFYGQASAVIRATQRYNSMGGWKAPLEINSGCK